MTLLFLIEGDVSARQGAEYSKEWICEDLAGECLFTKRHSSEAMLFKFCFNSFNNIFEQCFAHGGCSPK